MEGFAGVTAAELPGEPGPGAPCRVCGTPLPETLRCRNCGAAFGESHRCPHCRTITDVEPDGTLRYRCRVCGGPRVPTNDSKIVRSGREAALLTRARKDQLKNGLWKGATFASGFLALISVLSVLGFIALASPGVLASLTLLLLASVPAVFAAYAWKRAQSHGAELDQHLNQAWLLAASDVMASRGELGATELADIMRISEAQAEVLLAELSVQDFIHARVTDDGMLSYLAPARVRIAAASGLDHLEPVKEDAALQELQRATTSNPKQ